MRQELDYVKKYYPDYYHSCKRLDKVWLAAEADKLRQARYTSNHGDKVGIDNRLSWLELFLGYCTQRDLLEERCKILYDKYTELSKLLDGYEQEPVLILNRGRDILISRINQLGITYHTDTYMYKLIQGRRIARILKNFSKQVDIYVNM